MSTFTFYFQIVIVIIIIIDRRDKDLKIPGDALSRILEEEEMVHWARSVLDDRIDHHLCDGIR
jgi:hypothetical protein